MLGWLAVSAVSSRCVYAGVVEHSVYVDPQAQGCGVGRALLHALITSTEADGIWTIESGIFPENTASLALHRRAGFRVVGVRERIGRHAAQGDRWRDVVFVERRRPPDRDQASAAISGGLEVSRSWASGVNAAGTIQ